MDQREEFLLRRRMHGLYLTRRCPEITELSRELLGLHCWFARNAAFSAVIRGASVANWKTALTKTWLYRGTLHGAAFDELPLLLALHADEQPFEWLGLSRAEALRVADRVLFLMEDGVCSRAEMRRIFSYDYDDEVVARLFSPWSGIFVYLARTGRVAFRSMTSRDFDLVAAEPALTPEEALPILLERYFRVYGPATAADAAFFFGLPKHAEKRIAALAEDCCESFELGGRVYFAGEEPRDMRDVPELTLLSGFDPLVVSYAERGAILPAELRPRVILRSGICLPSVAVNGRIAGVWNIKKGEVTVEFFSAPPKRIRDEAYARAEAVRRAVAGNL